MIGGARKTIVQGLLAIHGGKLELRSKLREGTEAIAIFPPARVLERRDGPRESKAAVA